MDEEVKSSLDALEQRISATEKRFDDVKWYIGGASLIFSALIFVMGWNFSGERNALRESLNDMKTDLRSVEFTLRDDLKDRLTNAIGSMRELEDRLKEQFGQAAVPQLALLGSDGTPLAGQALVAQVENESDGTARLSFPFELKNTGNGASGPVWMKLYTQKDMPLYSHSADDPLYPTEARLEPGDLRPGNLPGKFSLVYTFGFRVPSLTPGVHRVLLRAFYGNGSIAEAMFSLKVK